MPAATIDLSIEPLPGINPTTSRRVLSETVKVLEELLDQSIRLRDLYKNARWQTDDVQFHRLRQLFDAHYLEQIRLVDVLIDRIRTLNGAARVFAGDFLHSNQFSQSLRGRALITHLLMDLVDAHEAALSLAQPLQATDEGVDSPWTRDFAVGQVVLSNDQQLFTLREPLMHQEGTPRTQPAWEC
jgi:starvation-inducible DNA-binding protein